MLKVIVCGTIVVLSLIQSWTTIRSDLASGRLYTTPTGKLLPCLLELLQDNKNAQIVQKYLADANINTFSGILDDPWKNVDRVLYYNSKLYISATLQTKLIARDHDNTFAGHLDIEKIQEFIARKYH